MCANCTFFTQKVDGIPYTVYNSEVGESNAPVVLSGKAYQGFYISYNNYDTSVYGDVTTALVLGQMEKFFILNGNHCSQYKELIDQGFFVCLEYFKTNSDQRNKYSDLVEEGDCLNE